MFSNQLRKYRLMASLSQKELASKLFVSQQAVARWETDKATPNPETIVKIAQIFGITTDELLGQKEKPTPVAEDGLTEEQMEIVNLFESASPALRAAALAVLKSAEEQSKSQDGASKAE